MRGVVRHDFHRVSDLQLVPAGKDSRYQSDVQMIPANQGHQIIKTATTAYCATLYSIRSFDQKSWVGFWRRVLNPGGIVGNGGELGSSIWSTTTAGDLILIRVWATPLCIPQFI